MMLSIVLCFVLNLGIWVQDLAGDSRWLWTVMKLLCYIQKRAGTTLASWWCRREKLRTFSWRKASKSTGFITLWFLVVDAMWPGPQAPATMPSLAWWYISSNWKPNNTSSWDSEETEREWNSLQYALSSKSMPWGLNLRLAVAGITAGLTPSSLSTVPRGCSEEDFSYHS